MIQRTERRTTPDVTKSTTTTARRFFVVVSLDFFTLFAKSNGTTAVLADRNGNGQTTNGQRRPVHNVTNGTTSRRADNDTTTASPDDWQSGSCSDGHDVTNDGQS